MKSILEYLMYKVLSGVAVSFKALKVGEVIDHALAELVDNATEAIFGTRPTKKSSGRRSNFRSYGGFPFANFATRAEALEILNNMRDLLDQYDLVTVADLYELRGDAASVEDAECGWTSLKGVFITHDPVTNVYRIKLPQPQPLNS